MKEAVRFVNGTSTSVVVGNSYVFADEDFALCVCVCGVGFWGGVLIEAIGAAGVGVALSGVQMLRSTSSRAVSPIRACRFSLFFSALMEQSRAGLWRSSEWLRIAEFI